MSNYQINKLRKYRRKGIARAVVHQFFNQYPGRYYIVQMVANEPAVKFWYKAYKELNGYRLVKQIEYSDGEPGNLYEKACGS